jgi:hypothetical protein
MQQGSIIQAERKIGPDVWEFRWREPGPGGKRKHRRMVIGRIDQLVDESAARGIGFCDASVLHVCAHCELLVNAVLRQLQRGLSAFGSKRQSTRKSHLKIQQAHPLRRDGDANHG